MARITRKERKSLRALARKRRGVAVYAHYNKGEVKFKYMGDWSPRKRRRRRP